METVFRKMLDELYEDKPNAEGVRLQKKSTLIGKEGEIFTLTIERGDSLNQFNRKEKEENPIDAIKDLLKIQGDNLIDEYMLGMYNGLECALACLTKTDPVYKHKEDIRPSKEVDMSGFPEHLQV